MLQVISIGCHIDAAWIFWARQVSDVNGFTRLRSVSQVPKLVVSTSFALLQRKKPILLHPFSLEVTHLHYKQEELEPSAAADLLSPKPPPFEAHAA